MIPLHASAPIAELARRMRCSYCGQVDPRCGPTELKFMGAAVLVCARVDPGNGVFGVWL